MQSQTFEKFLFQASTPSFFFHKHFIAQKQDKLSRKHKNFEKVTIFANPANKTFSNLFHSVTKHLKNRSDDVDRDGAFPFIIKSVEGVFQD